MEAGVPLTFNVNADSVSAEVVFRWTLQFGIDRTGQTDLTWDQEGHIVSGVVTIATARPERQTTRVRRRSGGGAP